jgi:hypothetical protein
MVETIIDRKKCGEDGDVGKRNLGNWVDKRRI